MELATSKHEVQLAFAAKAAKLRGAAALEVEERAAVPDVHVAIANSRPGWKLAPNFNGYVPESHDTAACEICQKPFDERMDIGD